MMSLAVHDFFAPFDASFYYVPIRKNAYYNLTKGYRHISIVGSQLEVIDQYVKEVR